MTRGRGRKRVTDLKMIVVDHLVELNLRWTLKTVGAFRVGGRRWEGFGSSNDRTLVVFTQVIEGLSVSRTQISYSRMQVSVNVSERDHEKESV